MIEKTQKLRVKNEGAYDTCDAVEKFNMIIEKINELVDAINTIQKEREAERFEIQEWISIIEAVRKSVNIHEKQIDELQMKIEPEKCEDQYAEQRKWIGKLCRFWNFKDGAIDIGILKAVDNLKPTIPYINDIDCSYAYCEPVKPDDDIIYKGGQK